jgi:hypothetical protein
MSDGATSPVTLRAATDSDGVAVRALVDEDLAGTPYGEVLSYFLGLMHGNPTESRAIVAEHRGECVGFALFGEVAGAVGTGRIHFVGTKMRAALDTCGAALCQAAVDEMTARGDRLIIAELPDDPGLAGKHALLSRCGFAVVARVRDYFRDGVDLVLLQRHVGSDQEGQTP